MFRSIALGFLQDEEQHGHVRHEIADYMTINRGEFEPHARAGWIKTLTASKTGTYDDYLAHVRVEGKWGDDACLEAYSMIHPSFKYRVWTTYEELAFESAYGITARLFCIYNLTIGSVCKHVIPGVRWNPDIMF